MKRYIIFILFVFLAIYSYSSPMTIYPGLTLEENSGKYYIHFEMPKYDIVTDTFKVTNNAPLPLDQLTHAPGDYYFSRFIPIEADYFDYLSEDGRPELPFYSLNLLMPHDGGIYTVVNAHILNTETIVLPFDYTPSQPENYTFVDFSFDAAYYGSYNNTWYWDDYTHSTLWYRKTNGFTFAIYPCHYEPSHRELTIVTEADFEIKYEGSFLTDSYLANLLQTDRSIYFFYDNFVGYPEPYPLIKREEYLIITADVWNNTVELANFVHHKESLGYHVTKTPLSDIGYSSAEIRKYIQKEYEKNNTKFVLLVGDVGHADSLAFSDGINEDEKDPPTDIYYSCLSKSNLNDQWKDFSPSVFVGRWPIQNGKQLRNIVDKTIASDLHLGHALINHGHSKIALFSGEDSNIYLRNYWYNDCKYIYNHIVQNYSYYSGCIHDGRSSSMNLDTLKQCLEIIDNPAWMFVYNGHGWNTWIAHPYDWFYTDIDYVKTSTLDFQPFGFGFSCYTGNIYAKENFARAWLTNREGGISYLGSTTTSTNVCNRYFSRKMFNQLKGRPNMTIGEFVGNAKAKYYNPDKVVWRRREAKKYVLYGDPSLYLFGLNIQYNQPHFAKQYTQNLANTDSITCIRIYSITGQLLRTCNSNQPDLQGLPAGTYMITCISANNSQTTQKIILQ